MDSLGAFESNNLNLGALAVLVALKLYYGDDPDEHDCSDGRTMAVPTLH